MHPEWIDALFCPTVSQLRTTHSNWLTTNHPCASPKNISNQKTSRLACAIAISDFLLSSCRPSIIMFAEHPPPSLLSPDSSPSDIDLFRKEVSAVQLLQSDFNEYAGTETQAHPSASTYEPAPDINLSAGTECVEKPWASHDTSWVPSGLVPPASGLALFDDDMSVISGSGGKEATLDEGVHVEEVCSGATALKNGILQQDNEYFLGSIPDYLNVVSPIAQTSFTSFQEPHLGLDLRLGRLVSDVDMEESEASVCTPRVNNLRCSGKNALWYENFRALQVSHA